MYSSLKSHLTLNNFAFRYANIKNIFNKGLKGLLVNYKLLYFCRLNKIYLEGV